LNPQQKTIERSFRDIKDKLRYALATSAESNFEAALREVVAEYNNQPHRFEHFATPVVPAILHSQVEYRRVDEEEIRRAFMERFIRVVRNNTIQIDNLKYEFIYDFESRMGEIGRTRRAPEVLCYRDLDSIGGMDQRREILPRVCQAYIYECSGVGRRRAKRNQKQGKTDSTQTKKIERRTNTT
jgi:hypothetical protein